MPSLARLLCTLVLLLLTAAGCGGAYAEAIARGDQLAQAGQWDEAAAAYQQAMRIDPNDAEAKIKLTQARRKQASERLARALAMERRGELAGALGLVQQAARLDPDSVDAQRALTRVTGAVLDRAKELQGAGKLRQAFVLTTLVLKGAPHHPRARQLDERLRSALADEAFARGKALVEKGKLGGALVAYAACLGYRPDYPDARLHFGQVKLRLEQELRFAVVLERLVGEGAAAALSRSIDPALLQQSFDERLLIEVRTKPPAEEGRHGVVLGGKLSDYAYRHGKKSIERACDYVCGKTYEPNPRIDQLRGELARIDQDLARHGSDISRAEQDQLRAEQELARKQAETDRRTQDADKARAELDRCRASAQPDDSSACSSEQARLRSRQSSLEHARRDVDSARQRGMRLRDELARTKERSQSTRTERERKNQELLREPEKIAVDKHCPFRYRVEQHAVDAKLSLTLSMRALGQRKSIVEGQRFGYGSRAGDETFPAQAGRCAEVASGDPLRLPSERELRKDLVRKLIKDLRGKVVAAYDAYRRGFLTAARRDEAAGLSDEAAESYVRYVLTGPHALESRKQIAAFFQKTRGLGKLEALWKN